jgi:hypothetical protein
MPYADFDATQARGMWSPPNGAAPQMLPDRWRDNPGDAIVTDIPDKTDDELVALGWLKVDMPSYATKGAAFFSNSYSWNSSTKTYDATELDEVNKNNNINYDGFWNLLLDTNVYATMKTAASTALAANTLLTEFIALLDDAKRGGANTTKIQTSITGILAGITFSTDELTELQTLFDSTGMSVVYTLS